MEILKRSMLIKNSVQKNSGKKSNCLGTKDAKQIKLSENRNILEKYSRMDNFIVNINNYGL